MRSFFVSFLWLVFQASFLLAIQCYAVRNVPILLFTFSTRFNSGLYIWFHVLRPQSSINLTYLVALSVDSNPFQFLSYFSFVVVLAHSHFPAIGSSWQYRQCMYYRNVCCCVLIQVSMDCCAVNMTYPVGIDNVFFTEITVSLNFLALTTTGSMSAVDVFIYYDMLSWIVRYSFQK